MMSLGLADGLSQQVAADFTDVLDYLRVSQTEAPLGDLFTEENVLPGIQLVAAVSTHSTVVFDTVIPEATGWELSPDYNCQAKE